MFNLREQIKKFLRFCECNKKLNFKTIKAHSIDLEQYAIFSGNFFDKEHLLKYIEQLHEKYKPKTVKRKIVCLKAFAGYMVYEEVIDINPFAKIKTSFKEPLILPKTISLEVIRDILVCVYGELANSRLTKYRKKEVIRDIAVLELLFATGARVSEICTLKSDNVVYILDLS